MPSWDETTPDMQRPRLDEREQSILQGGGPSPDKTSFADYAEQHPTETDLTIRALAPMAQTPEQQDQLGRFIASRKAPELETPGLAGQLWQTAWSAPTSTTDYVKTQQDMRNSDYQNTLALRAKAQAHGLDPDKVAPLPSDAERIAEGSLDAAEDLALTFQSPAGALTAGIGALPKALQRTVSAAFAAQMLSQAPDTAAQLLAEIRKPEGQRDYKKIAQLSVSGLADVGLGGLSAAHAGGVELPGAAAVWNRANDYLDAKAGQAAQWLKSRPITPDDILPAEKPQEQEGGVIDVGDKPALAGTPQRLMLPEPQAGETAGTPVGEPEAGGSGEEAGEPTGLPVAPSQPENGPLAPPMPGDDLLTADKWKPLQAQRQQIQRILDVMQARRDADNGPLPSREAEDALKARLNEIERFLYGQAMGQNVPPVDKSDDQEQPNVDTQNEQSDQQPGGDQLPAPRPPKLDVREPAGPRAPTPPVGQSTGVSGRPDATGIAPGAGTDAGAGADERRGVGDSVAGTPLPPGRPSIPSQPPGPGAAGGTKADREQPVTPPSIPPPPIPKPTPAPKALGPEDQNHVLPKDADWIPTGDKAKAQANIAAIKLLRKLEAENRNPTPEEKTVLAKYVGWGGLKAVFDEGKARYRERPPWNEEQQREYNNWEKQWGKTYDEVKALLTPEEHAAAGASILNAHYTSREIINKIWDAVQRMGFNGGKALEPAAGVGNFVGLTPEGIRGKTRWTAVELDSTSGRILAKLYPQALVHQTGFEKAKIPANSQDLVISNVPFAREGPTDDRYPSGLSLHNYFFARALDVVKPGGIVAAITSDSTMDNDSASRKAREYFAEKADLVGAIRLPNNAFKKNAGTEVTADILFFRKRDGTPFEGHPFLRTEPVPISKGEPVDINEYFAKHPEMMLGRMSREGTMHGPDQQALIATPGDLQEKLDAAIAKLPPNVLGAQTTAEDLAKPMVKADAGSKVGQIVAKDGGVYVVQDDGTLEKPEWANDPKKVAQAQRYMALRDHAKGHVALMLTDDATDADIQKSIEQLNKLYDEYVKKYGVLNKRGSAGNKFLDSDVDYPAVMALEDATPELVSTMRRGKEVARRVWTFSKSDMFRKRTVFPRRPPEHVDTVADALQVSMNFAGRVDPEYMAKLTGKPVEAVKQEMIHAGLAFENPKTGQMEGRAQYLSGFVKDKLKEATAAAADNPLYQKNVEELAKVQPAPVPANEIGLRLGSTWIPPQVVEKFLRDVMNVNAAVSYVEQTGHWHVEAQDRTKWDDRNTTKFGVHGWSGHELVEQSLNLKSAVVTHEVPNDSGKGTHAVKDEPKTLEAQEKQKQIQQEFKRYVMSSPEMSHQLADIYNDQFNGVVATKYDAPTWAHYPGASQDYQLRPHQKACVTRIMQNSTLLAHAVGTGKTFIMCTAAMEMRRLGLAKKPMIVVQNATLEQFARSFKQLYPTAKILCPSPKDREATERQRTMSRIATGDWDAVIVPQSFVNMLPDDAEREKSYMADRLKELEDAKIEAAYGKGKNSPKAADLERAIKKLKERLDNLAGRKKDNVLTFEQTGVDALFVDEAHAYKKLEFTTQMDNVKGLDKGASQRGLSMFFKTRWVQEHNQGRNVVFATGTPVSNTLAEAWNMMRYVRPDVLKAYGIENFDEFASTFGETITQLEMTAGGSWQPVTRFAKFTNGPELIQAWRQVADVVTPEEINLPGLPTLKTGKAQSVSIKLTPRLKAYIQTIRERLEAFAQMSGKEKKLNSHIPLVCFTLAKKASLDMRMVDSTAPDEPGSKLNVAADNVARIYADSTAVKGAQMIFADLYQDNPDNPRFNLYEEVKRKLIERGIPEKEILIVTPDIKDAKREALFTKLNDGDIRVAIGGSEKMGVGVNAQEHLVGLHHLDCPARPMDIEQRNGRIVRQGNLNPEVEVLNYGVENTLDAAMYQKNATKQRFINQILRGDITGRSFDDAANEQSLSFDEMMAAFSGDKRALERVALENQVRQLQALQSGHYKQIQEAHDKSAWYKEKSLPAQRVDLQKAEGEAAKYAKAFASEPKLEVGERSVTGKKEVAAALDEVLKGEIERLGERAKQSTGGGVGVRALVKLNGQTIVLDSEAPSGDSRLIKGDDGKEKWLQGLPDMAQAHTDWYFEDNKRGGRVSTGQGFFHSLAGVLERIAGEPGIKKGEIANSERNLRELESFAQTKFDKAAELDDAQKRLAALDAELKAEGEAQRKATQELLKNKPADLSGTAKQLIEAAQKMRTDYETQFDSWGLVPMSERKAAAAKVQNLVEQGIADYKLPENEAAYVRAAAAWDGGVQKAAQTGEDVENSGMSSSGGSKSPAQRFNDLLETQRGIEARIDAAKHPFELRAAQQRYWTVDRELTELQRKYGFRRSSPPTVENNMSSSGGSGGTARASRATRKPLTVADVQKPANDFMRDINRFRAAVAPQSLGEIARFTANLLRQLMGEAANEEARADATLRPFRNSFDRTPVPKNWKYDPTLPLPRNYAMIDAYEGGEAAALGPIEGRAAAELKSQNERWLDLLHSLGQGILENFLENYFPHLWDDPDKAKRVIAQSLAHSPMTGSRSFLKQRTHQLFRDGLAAGLHPVHDNPIDMWMLKRREISRYALGVQFCKAMQEAGLLRFVHVFSRPLDGWSTFDDRAFQRYGPPTVEIKEAFDAGAREATDDVLRKLGVSEERLAKIGGKGRWGYESHKVGEKGKERITMKFGGPDWLRWHELGHVLDNRYDDLWPTMTATDQMQDELRALADARWEGEPPSDNFKRYVRTHEEKMAVILQAYLHAPKLMEEKAPTIKKAFEGFLAAHPELKIINDIKPGLRLGEAATQQAVGGLVKLGSYYMPDQAAAVVRSYLSPGLNPHLWYRTLRETSNMLNAIQLGLSAFHLGFTSLDAMASRVSVAIKDLVPQAAGGYGELGRGLRTLASVPFSPLTNLRAGHVLKNAVLADITDGEIGQMVKALEAGGGRVGQDGFWQTEFTRRMVRAFHEYTASGFVKGTLNAPFALVEQLMKPIMSYIVPRQKLGVFAEMAKRELLALGPNVSPEDVREAMRKCWDSVDNRMGQVVYDNLFYNRALKDVSLLTFRAYGWQLGKAREGGGGAYDAWRYAKDISGGKRPDFSHRMAYVMALPLLVGVLGYLVTRLFTHSKPKGMDYFMPRIGGVDANGNPLRVNFPSYIKDVIAYQKHPAESFGHSLNPLASSIWDLLENRNFYDVRIRNEDDPIWKQGSEVAEWAVKEMVPFSVSGAIKMNENGSPAWKQVAPYFGVTPAPARLTMTPAQELAAEISAASMPKEPRTQESYDRSQIIKSVVRDLQAGNRAQAKAELRGGFDQGKLSPGAAQTLVERLQYTPLQFQVHFMNPEAAMRVWRVANANERQQLQPIIGAAIANSKTMPMAQKLALGREMREK